MIPAGCYATRGKSARRSRAGFVIRISCQRTARFQVASGSETGIITVPVVEKVLYLNEALGGISRLNFQMTLAAIPHEEMLRAIKMLGTGVAPAIRKSLG